MREVAIGIDKSGDAAWISCLMDWKGTSQGRRSLLRVSGLQPSLKTRMGNGPLFICTVLFPYPARR